MHCCYIKFTLLYHNMLYKFLLLYQTSIYYDDSEYRRQSDIQECSLVASGISFKFNYSWDNLSKVSDVLDTFGSVHRFPKLQDPFN